MAKIAVVSINKDKVDSYNHIPCLVHLEFTSKELLDKAIELGFDVEGFKNRNGQDVLIKE